MKKILFSNFFVIVLTLVFSTSAFSSLNTPEEKADEYEPNNTPEEAVYFENHSVLEQGHIIQAYIAPDDLDYYLFYTPTSALQLVIFYAPDNQNYLVSIFLASELLDRKPGEEVPSIVKTYTNGELGVILPFHPIAQEKYIVLVEGYDGAHNEKDRYTLIAHQTR
ncbi:hypothetical protein [Caldalkalibacillus mannanilyticus]|uniref:hypothetical protein n=1 Tax=Caldalkalibacillus mannanilyticus TaxID=1418 RepID=UPI000469C8A9|nr:hypothetical protein [Caldalkalibacillus mannanilyticus]